MTCQYLTFLSGRYYSGGDCSFNLDPIADGSKAVGFDKTSEEQFVRWAVQAVKTISLAILRLDKEEIKWCRSYFSGVAWA